MKTIQHPLAETSTDEIDLFALIQSLWQQKKLILGTTCVVGALALGYAMLAPREYQASTVLRPAAINELDALNRSEVYKLPPTEALLKVGAALDSYETRFNFFESHLELFEPLQKKGVTLEQSFEIFNRDAINLIQPDPKKQDSLSPFLKLEMTYPESVDGVKILNGFVEYAINNQRAQIGADLKVIINNRLRELEEKIDAARSGYKSDKEGKIATLIETDTLERAKLKDELQALRLQLKTERESRIAQLSEAISIARSLGITRPTTPSAMSDAGKGSTQVMRTEITSQSIPLYFMGTQALEAERAALLKRTSDDFTDKRISTIGKKLQMLEVNRQVEQLAKRSNEDLFLKNIEPLRAEVVRLGNLNTDMSKLGIVSIDRKAQTPASPSKPKKALIVGLGLILGCLLGLGIATVRFLVVSRRVAS
ncbi:Wzz/FepE/Etk N-terminal domain-containing protein [Pseudomonas lundensis]|uniref:Wzz/FepE/Etk N-terminal domain-containing protein n=1 Tax=Pseudomonas lundensis TaxID=86185 RepID=UPI002015EB13|nr:Wzz/FepE/Etk N-terminal domain-containing protein [Pseudomonas lundensis]